MPPSSMAQRKVITRSIEGPIVETNYAQVRARALKVAQRLDQGRHQARRPGRRRWPGTRGGISKPGTASLGIGAIYHTVNPRLFPEQIVWIVNHAEDRMMIDRSHLRAAAGKDRRQAADHRALHRAHRRRAYAADHAEERGRLRGLDRRGRRRFRNGPRSTRTPPPACATPPAPPGIPRACSIRTAPTCCTPIIAALPDCQGHLLARRGDAGGADVPRQLLVARLLDADGRRHAGDARRQDGRRLDLRTAQHLQSQLHRRGADGVADAAAGSGEDRRQAAASQARGDRRLGLPARHDQDLPGHLRRRGGACLGHDRDEPARLALHHEAGIRRAHRRGASSTCR